MSDDDLDPHGFPMPLSERLYAARGAKFNDGARGLNYEAVDRAEESRLPPTIPGPSNVAAKIIADMQSGKWSEDTRRELREARIEQRRQRAEGTLPPEIIERNGG